MPEIGCASYLLTYLFEIGVCNSTGFGVSPISWSEISAWSELTQIKLLRFEALTIKMLSNSFVSQYNESDDSVSHPPYLPVAFDPVATGVRIGSFLRGLIRRKN